MLSIISVYDPVTFVSPLTLQRICFQKFQWDETIPDEELVLWKKLAGIAIFSGEI